MSIQTDITTRASRRASKRTRSLRWCALVVALMLGGASVGVSQPLPLGYQVIVHPSSSTDSADRRFLTSAFLKKLTSWPDGTDVHPIDLRQGSPVRERFSDDVLGRSVTAIGHYWLQIIFSGRGVPPPELSTDDEVVRFVLRHPGAVGYVSEGANLRGAKPLRVKQ